jgi:hypothetical protein
MAQVLEGIWEEVVSHTDELSGRRVRVIVLDRKDAPAMQECLARLNEANGHSGRRKWAREELYSDENLH